MKILLALVDAAAAARVSHLLRGRGLEVEEAANGRQAFSRGLSGRFALAVIDPSAPGWGGERCLSVLADARPLLRVILAAPDAAAAQALRERYAAVRQVAAVLVMDELPAQLLEQVRLHGSGLSSRAVRIVATIGPASAGEASLRALLAAGVDVVRLNFSHGTHAGHQDVFQRVRTIAAQEGRYVAILQDLCGPKIRVGALEDGAITLAPGWKTVVCDQDTPGTRERFGITMPEVLGDLVPGDRVLLDDGNLELLVEEGGARAVSCRVVHGGLLRERKGVNLPGAALRLPGLTEKDRDDLRFGIGLGVDYVAVSFVREAAHVREAKKIIAAHGADIPVIAKIEKPDAVASLEAILDAADGLMIARGDLGVELAATRVPQIQRRIVQLARECGKPVITATQMLESMIERPRPTRAEVADVTKAIEDGTDAVMLSGETAAGRYPVLAVETMAAVAQEAVQWIRHAPNPHIDGATGRGLVPALSQGLALIADRVDVAFIAVATRSGSTARSLSNTHPDCPVLALSDDETVLRRMALYYGVHAARSSDLGDIDALMRAAQEASLRMGLAHEGDIFALLWDPEWKGGRRGSLAVRFQRVGGADGPRA